MGDCIRTGMCCQRIPIPVSPRQLREAYEEFHRRLVSNNYDAAFEMTGRHDARYPQCYRDIELIYPMLKDRCLGKITLAGANKQEVMIKSAIGLEPPDWHSYVYGPCRFFERTQIIDGRMVGGCSINEIKPWMCSSYPNGGTATFRGCGYNAGTENGLTFDAFAKLEPLTEDEK